NVEHVEDVYVETIAEELRNSPGFTWQNWDAAAQYCLQAKTHLPLGLEWAKNAVGKFGVGQENFTTLVTLSQLQEANGMTADATKTMELAMNHRTAGPLDIHGYARSLQALKKNDDAMRIFQLNAKRYPGVWPTEVGLMRVYSAKKDYKEA